MCIFIIYNKATILLLISIYDKNQANVSQDHTKDFSRLSNEDNNMHSQKKNFSAASNQRVLVEYYRPKQAPNLRFGQNLPVSILT